MAKINYLILAHKNPEQLERMIKTLNDEHSCFYIHIDKKTDINLFSSLKKINTVTFIENRVDNVWGDFSSVIATINLVEVALKKEKKGMFILLSGMDYPIKPKQAIHSFINLNSDKNFIDMEPANEVWDSFNRRSHYYKVSLSSTRGDFVLLKGLNLRTLKYFFLGKIPLHELIKIISKKRKLHLNLDFYGGSQWWAMNFNTLTKVQDYIITNKATLYDYFKYSLLPDEWFFQSIIHHLKKTDLSIRTEKSLTYVNWTRKNCNLPVTFVNQDIDELMNQKEGLLFARKFDIEMDLHILDSIDKNFTPQ